MEMVAWEDDPADVQVAFDKCCKLELHGPRIVSDVGPLVIDDVPDLTKAAVQTHAGRRTERSAALTALAIMVAVGGNWAGSAHALSPGATFRDCETCPEMVVVAPGSFMMGGDENFEETDTDESPRHRVAISHPFAIGKYEVTQAEWVAVMGDNPSRHKGRSRPVESVSWAVVQEFIDRLNANTGMVYRLPTEAEWEYAARAGSSSTYSFGDNPGLLSRHGWYAHNTLGLGPRQVGMLSPNRYGLHDMHGNVWEWTADCYIGTYIDAPTDGTARQEDKFCHRVYRGGSWSDHAWHLRSATRNANSQMFFESADLGFRLVRTLK